MKTKVVLGFLIFALGSPLQAAVIQQFNTFNTSAAALQSDLFAFDPFDTALGTLDRVSLNFQGTVTNFSLATQNLLPIGPFGSFVPVPYDYRIGLDMDVFSLAGFDFDFASDARFIFSGNNSGLNTIITGTRTFSLTTEFDEITDFIGFDVPTVSGVDFAPVSIDSSRADFESNLVTASLGLQFQMVNIWSVIFEDGAAAVITPTGRTDGLLTLTYEYTSIPAIPVPAAAWLFGTALIGLVGFNRRRKQLGPWPFLNTNSRYLAR